MDKKLIEGFSKIGIAIPEILLPKDIDLKKWCVVAMARLQTSLGDR